MKKGKTKYRHSGTRRRNGGGWQNVTLKLLVFSVLIFLMLSIAGCGRFSHQPPPTVTEYRYVVLPKDLIQDIQLPGYQGQTGEDLIKLLEGIAEEAKAHNKEQQKLREINEQRAREQ